MLSFNSPLINHENIEKKRVNVIIKGLRWNMYAVQLWFTIFHLLLVRTCTFLGYSFPLVQCVYKYSLSTLSPSHAQYHYHYPADDTSNYLSIKCYQALNRLQTTEHNEQYRFKFLIQCLRLKSSRSFFQIICT